MVEMIVGILLKKITKSLELVWDGYYEFVTHLILPCDAKRFCVIFGASYARRFCS